MRLTRTPLTANTLDMKDESVIPPGGFCYRVRKISPGEVLSSDIDRFGKDLREFSFGGGFKEILCPYWRRTDYGMVRCEFLGVEGLDERAGAKIEALAHYGSEAAFSAANQSPDFLSDEIKICDVKDDEDEDWDCMVADS